MRNVITKYSWTCIFSLQSEWRENLDNWTDDKVDDYLESDFLFKEKFALYKV